jgi:hypothetical protein
VAINGGVIDDENGVDDRVGAPEEVSAADVSGQK